MPTIKRSPLPSLEEAQHEVQTKPFVTAPVISVLMGISLGMVYSAIGEGSIPSVRVGSKHRIPTGPYREAMALKLPMAAPEQVAA